MTKHIVIIEDDPGILDLLTMIFEDEGYSVSGFGTGRSALAIGTMKPDVVLLDINLVGCPMTGDMICSELKALLSTSKIPVMLLSAQMNLRTIAKPCLSDDCMAKPFKIDELLDRMRILAA